MLLSCLQTAPRCSQVLDVGGQDCEPDISGIAFSPSGRRLYVGTEGGLAGGLCNWAFSALLALGGGSPAAPAAQAVPPITCRLAALCSCLASDWATSLEHAASFVLFRSLRHRHHGPPRLPSIRAVLTPRHLPCGLPIAAFKPPLHASGLATSAECQARHTCPLLAHC